VFFAVLFWLILLLSRKQISIEFATLHLVFPDRRATARTTTFVEPCSIQTKKMSLDDWYAGVYALPTARPDVSMLGADNLRRVAGYDFHLPRKKYDVQSMWGDLEPPKGQAGIRFLSEKSGFLLTGRIGLVMI